MNAWIFQYHPSGRSFAEVLLDAGFDPWGVDLRGASTARRTSRDAGPVDLDAQVTVDLPAVLDFVRGRSGAERVHAIGCSLGGSLLFAHAAFAPEPHLDHLVAIGAPLAWEPSLTTRALARLLRTGGRLPLRGTRRIARHALPWVARGAPGILSIYLNPRITDLRDPEQLTRTVEDPVPALNLAIARWMRGQLVLGGQPVAPALRRFDRPLLVVHGSGDGVVPRGAALSVVGATSGPVEVALVSHPAGEPVGHADLFVSEVAPEQVFARTARFLAT
jgi:alpha-beta hydrolase superfamily lysophospholipase